MRNAERVGSRSLESLARTARHAIVLVSGMRWSDDNAEKPNLARWHFEQLYGYRE